MGKPSGLGVSHMLGVQLLRDGDPVGVITMTGSIVKPFTDRQVELMRTFADQAVIAMKTCAWLTDSAKFLDDSGAAEVLKVIYVDPPSISGTRTGDTLVEFGGGAVRRSIMPGCFQREDGTATRLAGLGHRTDVHTRMRDYFKPLSSANESGQRHRADRFEARVVRSDVFLIPGSTWSEAQKIWRVPCCARRPAVPQRR